MEIGGVVKNSFIDYPGKISFVIFTIGCNFRCWYCHNSHLFSGKSKYTLDKIYEFLKTHRRFLDGVVISGGEPTLQKDLKEVIRNIKKLGYSVKLDTNGTKFGVLKSLIDSHLVDYVAMDIKAPLEDYEKIVGKTSKALMDNVKKSMDYLMQGKVEYEFRTTFSPDLTLKDIEKICKEIKGANTYCIQKYRIVEQNKKNMAERLRKDHYLAGKIAKKYVKNVILRGVD